MCKKKKIYIHIHPILTQINRVHSTVIYNIHTKFELNRMHHLVKKNILPAYTKINTVRGMVVYGVHIKFELNQKHRLDTTIILKI